MSGDRFPETQETLLLQAAAGQWEAFLAAYLRPCWREVLIVCRQRDIPLGESDDLFQTVLVRLLVETRGRTKSSEAAPPANLPARFLAHRHRYDESARFRTYLKATILNVVREWLRKQRRRGLSLDEERLASIEPYIEQTITCSLDQQWLAGCLHETACQLRALAQQQTTRGRQRWFDVFRRSLVDGQPSAEIARHLSIDRSNASRLLSEARARFVALLQKITGIDDRDELKRLLASNPALLRSTFANIQSVGSSG